MLAEGQPGHIDQIKQTNAGTVYRLIDRCGPISRIELARRAELAPASITKIVREMLEAHLVQETEFQEAGSRGRPAVGLMLDTQSWHFLSVRIGNGDITLSLRDLSSKVVAEDRCSLSLGEQETLLSCIIAKIDAFFIRHQNKLERLTAIAITLPGIINARSGIVHRMPFYQISDMPLGPELEKRTGLPVYIQRDICGWTLAESLFGAAQDVQNVIQVVIDHQVGAGVITGGRLLHNGSSRMVEIGHIQIDPLGKQCYCGNHGCLETVASSDNLLDLAASRLKNNESASLRVSSLTLEKLCEAALAADPLANELITGVGQSVGRIVAIMVNLFNPQKILIGSPLNRVKGILFPAIIDCIRRQALPVYSQQIEVEPTQFDNSGTMPGAALIKDALYSGNLLVKLLQG